MNALLRLTLAVAAISTAAAARAELAYYETPLRAVDLIDGKLPSSTEDSRNASYADLVPRIVVDGDAEAYLAHEGGRFPLWVPYATLLDRIRIHVEGPKGTDVTGRIYLPHPNERRMVALRFTIPAAKADPAAKAAFLNANETHYRNLCDQGIPGAAWFRHQALAVKHKSADALTAISAPTDDWWRRRELDRTYAMFTGGRGVAENLQLNRELLLRGEEVENVPLDSIRGITVEEIDWSVLTEGLDPKHDPLAKYIPADQHVVFFASFAAAARLADEAIELGTPVLRSIEPRAEDARTQQRYEHQLGCSMGTAARLLGPHMVKSVALTGSDPYYRTGTDVAVLFETDRPALLAQMLAAQVGATAAATPDVETSSGQIDGLKYRLVRSPDRTICSYLVALDDAVVLTNSPYQIERLAEVRGRHAPDITTTPEYRFFRGRYPLGDDDETALIVITDATIRRWCGPRWRIATSCRTRIAAMLAELQATQADTLAREKSPQGTIHTRLSIGEEGSLTLSPAGVVSSTQGSLGFLTPIAEIPMTEVAKAEAEGYERWRDGYQRNWTVGFDPIALRIKVSDGQLASDLTVMPLIAGTVYRDLIDLTAGATFEPRAGDPHDALLQLVVALNKKSRHFRGADNWAGAMKAGMGLGWLGQSLSLYVDEGPFWKELAEHSSDEPSRNDFLFKNFHRAPVAVQAEVANGFQLVGFLAAFRGWLEQTAPGMLTWETIDREGDSYVKVSTTPRARGLHGGDGDYTAFYAASGDALIASFDEDVLRRALARQKQRREAATQTPEPAAEVAAKESAKDTANTADVAGVAAASPPDEPWLGKSVALRVDRGMLDVVEHLTGHEYQQAMQRAAWNNLPILNEWHARYPDADPVAIHERIWGTRLVCPGGGRYVWNDDWQTMESTVHGHPGEPKSGPVAVPLIGRFRQADFGLTFENNGLRAQVKIERAE
ncbi:MAG TPA: hypothetical protein DD670_15260 [Planctomycetaceae bacterium]|nr:hypothetical protein [Planctomycetaceae bacterium]